LSLKVQFGCGGNILEGWSNHDADVDVTKRLPYNDGAVDEILIEHCLEHVSAPDMFRFLLEAKRILKTGGVLHVSMPVLDYLEPDHARDIILGHGHMTAWTRDSLGTVCTLAGFKDMEEDIDINAGNNEFRPIIYGHHRVIGIEKDELESFRIRLTK